MTRALIAVGVALALCIGGFVLLVVVTRDEESIAVDNLLAEDLSRAIALADDRVRLADVARFPWDEVLIVARDAPPEAISRALGYEWSGELRFRSTGGELLIFLEDGQVARFADYRGEGRFEGFDEPVHRLSREAAVLRVDDLVITPA